jgi:hypothetical protein
MVLFPAMFDPANTSTPQFGTAEYAGTPNADVCQFCKQPVSQQYYRVREQMACGTCAEIARQQTPVDTHSAYGQALLFGVGAAVAGMAGYATLLIVLKGATIGYFSFGVGYLVGWAMMKGSNGLGGRKYQITAALLTYAAVSVAAVPFELALIYRHYGRLLFPPLGRLLLYGLASPFYDLQDPLWGAIGLVILFVGIRIAWKITQGRPDMEVTGPFNSSSPRLA